MKGFPMSLFHFLLVVETLNLLLRQAKRENKIKGVNVTSQINLTHLLFVHEFFCLVWEKKLNGRYSRTF